MTNITPIHKVVVSKFCLREKQVPGSLIIRHQAAQKVIQVPVDGFSLAIRLEVESIEKFQCCPHLSPYGLPKIANKFSIPVGKNCLGQSLETDYNDFNSKLE